MNPHNVISIGDSESEFSGSIAWMEIPDDISSGSSAFGEQEFVDETFLVPKSKAKSSKTKKTLINQKHVIKSPVKGITFEKAVAMRYNFKKPAINNGVWKKKILEFKHGQNFNSNNSSFKNLNNSSSPKSCLPVVLLEKTLEPEKVDPVEFSQKQQNEQNTTTCHKNKKSLNSLDFYVDGKLRVPAEYLPVVLLKRITVPEKIVETVNVKSSRQQNLNPSEENYTSSIKSNSAVDKKIHKCKQCDYKSEHKSRLKSHMLCHSADLPFKCPKCSFGTRYLHNLRKHISALHNNEFPYRCPRCSLGFTELSQLSNNHSTCFFAAEKSFECDICKKKLSRAKGLNDHKRKYHSVKLFTCSFCQEILRDKYSYELHIKTHKNGLIYVCDKCAYKTTKSAAFRKHCDGHR